jgi:beta-lactamase class A
MLRIISIICLLGIMSCGNERTTQVKKEIREILEKEKGTFAVAFKDLTTGEEILMGEHEVFHAASTMKTPVMIELYNQVAQGKISLTDSILIKNEFKSIVDGSPYVLSMEDDSDQDLYDMIGKRMTLQELMHRMIVVSSNLATNAIIELVDAKNVTTTMRKIGANDIKVLRGVEDGKAFEKGLNNQTSAYDLMLMFEKIGKGEMISAEASDAMTNILLDQRFNEIIPAKLPKDVKVAHKTGNIRGIRHDGGIVLLPEGKKYVVILLSKGLENEDAGVAAMASVSEILYKHVIDQ